jgi:hypothetical protein
VNRTYEYVAMSNRVHIIGSILKEEQNGFREACSCINCVFTKTQLIEKRNEFKLATYIALIDYIKAFDMVNRNKLWQILALKGFPQHLIRAIQNLYEETSIMIENGDGKGRKRILISQGVRQGCLP